RLQRPVDRPELLRHLDPEAVQPSLQAVQPLPQPMDLLGHAVVRLDPTAIRLLNLVREMFRGDAGHHHDSFLSATFLTSLAQFRPTRAPGASDGQPASDAPRSAAIILALVMMSRSVFTTPCCWPRACPSAAPPVPFHAPRRPRRGVSCLPGRSRP